MDFPTLATARFTIDADGVMTVLLDLPGKSVNVLTPLVFEELDKVLDLAEEQKVAGILFTSGKARSFVAGADLVELTAMQRSQLEQFLEQGQALFDRIANLRIPTVAAINGDCLGGGLELALACTSRVTADQKSISIGLPEVKLGLIPGWGGTVRLPALIGLEKALPLLVAGATMQPAKAGELSIVDAVVPSEQLLPTARAMILQKPKRPQAPDSQPVEAILSKAKAQTIERGGKNYPAPLRLIDVVRTGMERGRAAGLQAERAGLADLIEGPVARNLIRLFFLRQGAKKTIFQQINATAGEIKTAAVVGGGTMGAGIVHALIRAGIEVHLLEVNEAAVASALSRVQQLLEDDIKNGRLIPDERDATLNHLIAGTQWEGLEHVDLAIEAVVERLDAKRDVFAKLDAAVRADCVLATNTSSLSVTEIALATKHPSRVVGLHFFNPVPRMPLVEVVRTGLSDESALATAAGLAIKLGKTPVLVNDAPGFIVNRVLIPYLAEAIELAREGVSITSIDDAMKQWGMPMGPFELLDEIGLDVSSQIIASLRQQLSGRVPAAPILERTIEKGWLGRKSGRGFYLHEAGKRAKALTVNPEMDLLLREEGTAAVALSAEEITWRLVLPMVNEAAYLLAERVVASVDAIDLTTVLGAGLAPFRGGLARFIDAAGIETMLARSVELAGKMGPRFEAAPLLQTLHDRKLLLEAFEQA